MNKAYRSVWNESAQTWVAVQENARGRSKGAGGSDVVSGDSVAGALGRLSVGPTALALAVFGAFSPAAFAVTGGLVETCQSGSNTGSTLVASNTSVYTNTTCAQANAVWINGDANNKIYGGAASNSTQAAIGVNGVTGVVSITGGSGIILYNQTSLNGSKIISLGNGIISSNSGDAVNGSQLYGLSYSLASAIGGGSAVNADGTLSKPSFALTNANSIDGTTGPQTNINAAFNTVDTALGQLNNAINNINNTGGTKYFHTNSTLADSSATGTNSIAVGPAAVASATNTVAIGNGATATNSGNIAIGNAQAINGSGASNAGLGNIAIGDSAQSNTTSNAGGAGSGYNTAVGQGANATGDGTWGHNTALGGNAKTGGLNSVAVGANSSTSGNGSVAVGFNSAATGAFSDSIGYAATASGTQAFAAGASATATATNALALGAGAQATTANSVALGNGATTAAAVGTASGVIGGTTYNYAGTSPTGTVSVGAAGAERTLTNVAAGRVTATSTDAVNGSQLYATNTQVTANTTSISSLSGSVTTLQGNVTTINGQITTINGKLADAVLYDSSAHNSVTLGGTGASTPVALHNVANGALSATSTDAVNGSQLYATNANVTNVTNSVNNIVNGGGIKYFHTNSTQADSSATGTDSTAIGPAATAAGTSAIATGTNAQALGYASVATGNQSQATGTGDVALGSTALASGGGTYATAIGTGSQANAAGATALGGSAKATAANAMALGYGAQATTANSVALGNGASTAAAVGTTSGVIGGTTYTYAGTAPTGTVSVGKAGAERTLTNVAAGQVTASSTDAVNGSQLYAADTQITANTTSISNLQGSVTTLQGNVTTINGQITTINGKLADAVMYDSSAHNSVTLGGTGASTPVALHNVANGALSATSTDAVNGSQLNATNANVTNVTNTVNNITNGGGIKYFHTNSTLADSSATGTNSTAIGPQALASFTGDVALGYGATATGNATTTSSLAIGPGATAINSTAGVGGGYGSIAIGSNAQAVTTATGGSAGYGGDIAIGINANATGTSSWGNNTAIGLSATTSGYDGTALGAGALATTQATALGRLATATGNSSEAVGWKATASGDHSVAMGTSAIAGGSYSTAIGAGANASVANSVALGNSATTAAAVTTSSGVIGGTTYNYAGGTPTGVVSVGTAGATRQIQNVAAGQVTASSTDAVNGSQLYAADTQITANTTSISNLQGSVTTLQGNVTTINGQITTINGKLADAVMYDSSAHNSVTLGGTGASTPVALHNVANGALSATSTDAVNGSQLYATNANVSNVTNSVNNIVNGGGIKYFHTNSTQADSSATGTDSTAIGPAATAAGTSAIATGTNAQALGYASVATGNQSQATGTGDVALGSTALASGGGTYATAIGTGSQANAAGATALGGSAKATAANAMALGSGAQATTANSVALGNGASTAAAVGTTSGVIGGTTYTYAGTAPTGTVSVGKAGAERTITNVAAGQVTASSTDAVNGSQLYAADTQITANTTSISNLQGSVTTLQGNVTTINGQITTINGKLADAVMYDSSAHNSVTLGGTGASTPVALHNVANGALSATSLDAVNGSQLYATNTNVSNLAGNVTTINGQITTINGKLADAVLYDSSAHNSVTLGGTGASTPVALHNVANGALSSTSTDAVNGSQLYATNTNVSNLAGNVTTINGQITNINGKLNDAVLYDSSAHNSVTLGGTGATSAVALHNVANGALNASSLDAVNGSQLYATNTNVSNLAGNVTTINGQITNINGKLADAVLYDSSTHNSVTLGGTGATSAVALHNVANGALNASSTDAVNGSQLYATNTNVSNLAGDVTTIQGNISNLAGDITNINGQLADSVLYDSSAHNSVTLGGTDATSAVALHNVANGALNASSLDAVNGSQLYATNTNVSNLAGNVTNLAGDVTTINGQITNMQGQLADAVLYDSSAHDSVTLGGTGATSAVALHNVANGALSASSLDAVNGSQLYATNTNVSNLAGNVTNLAGDVTTLQGDVTTINGQITNMQGQLADAVLYDSSAHDSVTLGGTGATSAVALHNVANGTLSTSSLDAVNGSQLYATNTNVSNLAGDVTTIQGNISNLAGDITNINGQLADSVLYDSSAHDSVTLGGTGATSAVALHNVANGALSASSLDAVNGSQLYATNTNVSNLAGNVTNLAGDVTTINGQITNMQGQLADAVLYDSSAHESVTLGGTGATSAVALHNVANGVLSASSLDAVNGSQLYATNTNVSNLAGNVTNLAGDVTTLQGDVTTINGQIT
ncbi:ESPR-type extended signal peptide-containing protein, partial [Paraburkholderia sp. JHI869]|uniref:ESPR-type extended signal peptide-containing protein n=1 Tax=Paraburkholderia sp. JHI869 TaxID=3112959 RepID=UPI003181B6FA